MTVTQTLFHFFDQRYSMLNNTSTRLLAAIACMVAGLSGCATPDPAQLSLAPKAIPVTKHHQKNVEVSVKASRNAYPRSLDPLSVAMRYSPDQISEALQQSIIESGVFKKILLGPSTDYLLDVTLVRMSDPPNGTSFTVDLDAVWTLKNARTGNAVMKETIKSSYTATMSSAFDGGARFSLAVRGAIRENIANGLSAISKLELN